MKQAISGFAAPHLTSNGHLHNAGRILKEFVPFLIIIMLSAIAINISGCTSGTDATPEYPNIIYILADDLGYKEVGVYGQTKIRTPRLDQLAAEGIAFTQHYSGSPVCAPSRGTYLTGKHTGHGYIRDNKEMGGWGPDEPEGQLPLPPGEFTIAEMLQPLGYTSGFIGKWGLGGPESIGHPNAQGFEEFYGYLCQRVAHNYYPTHLWHNDYADSLDGNTYFAAHQKLTEPLSSNDAYTDAYTGGTFAPDKMLDTALQFVRDNQNGPFFLTFATPVPHVALQVPEESLAEYGDSYDDKPYLGQHGYLPHPLPNGAYAAMISRMDRDIGQIIDLVDELGLADNTVIMFSSDNGTTYAGGVDAEFFDSVGELRGLKGSVFEGGIRVPMIVRWPGVVKGGTWTDHISANWDVMPTIASIVGIRPPEDIDGVSFLATLEGNEAAQQEHDALYWEYHAFKGMQAVRMGDWKAVRQRIRVQDDSPVELYNLAIDLSESNDVAKEHPDVVAAARAVMDSRTPSEIEDWNFKREESIEK
jgi:arylsulfatase A